MTKKTKRNVPTVDYTTFLRSLHLIFTSLVESHFVGDRKGYFDEPDHQLSISWKCKPVWIKPTSFEVRADVEVKVSNSKETVFSLTASFLLHLHTPKPVSKEHIHRFTESEVRLLVWPYVREYVTGMCGRMHVPPIIVPFAGSADGADELESKD